MTRDEALEVVEVIRLLSRADKAHALKADLYEQFIRAVAKAQYSSIREARNVAEAVLEAEDT